MSLVPSFFLVLLCLSMHACIARHFGFVKVADGSIKEGIDAAVVNQDPKMESKIVSRSSGQVSWRLPSKDSNKHPGFHSDYSMPRMRGEIFKSSSLVVPLKATNIEGSTRRGLSVVRFGSNKNVKEAKKNKVHEDIEVMDYDPPHRTPPIHNRKA